ncbi:hypothetical protein ACVXG7_19150 [Enterobacter hormaechei]
MMLITGAPDVLFRLRQHQQTQNGLEPFNCTIGKRRLKRCARRIAHGGCGLETGRQRAARADACGLQEGHPAGIAGMMDPRARKPFRPLPTACRRAFARK